MSSFDQISPRFAGRTLAVVGLPVTMPMTLAVLAMHTPAEVIALNQRSKATARR